MDAKTLRKIMIEAGLSVKEGTEKSRLLALERTLAIILKPHVQSDRTCLKKVIKWLAEKIESGKFDIEEMPSRLLDYALEASGPLCRNSWAVFMNVIKKELGYPD